MAKQLVNPVERHLEKGILAIAGVVLIGVVVMYVAASPNQLELGREMVSPASIDQKLARTAEEVRNRIRDTRVDEELPDPLYATFVQRLDPYENAGLPLELRPSVPLGPEVPIVDAAEVGAGRVDLATVIPVGTAAFTQGRSTFLVGDPQETQLPVVSNWVTVSAMFDVKAQSDRLRREYGVRRKEVIFGPPELQRRQRRTDGSWSDDDWQNVDGWQWPPTPVPRLPRITLLQERGRVVISPRDKEAVEQFFTELSQPLLQRDMLRPLLPEIVNGDQWDFPIITTRRDVLMGDDQYMFPNDPPAANPVDRYGGATITRAVVEQEKSIADQLVEIEQRIKEADKNIAYNEAMRAYNDAFDIRNDPTASSAERAEAGRLAQYAEDIAADIKRKERRRAVVLDQKEEEVRREPRPTQQFWVHDGGSGSVKSGEVYQYRTRPTIANLLAGSPDRFRDPIDATKFLLTGDWSEPVEVEISPDMWFFITSESKRNNEVGVEIYRWFEGIWVKCPRRIQAGVGSKIWAEARTEVPDRYNPGETERPTVTYDAEATVVDIDFDRTYREHKRGKGRNGVNFGDRTTACSVVLADSNGRLFERFVIRDKKHPQKDNVADRVWKAPK